MCDFLILSWTFWVLCWDSRSYLNLVYLPSLILCHGGRDAPQYCQWGMKVQVPHLSSVDTLGAASLLLNGGEISGSYSVSMTVSHWVWKGCLCFPLDFHLVWPHWHYRREAVSVLAGRESSQSAFSSITSLQSGGNPSVASTDTVGRSFWLLGEGWEFCFSTWLLQIPCWQRLIISCRVES